MAEVDADVRKPSRTAALAAFLLLATGALLPWWVVAFSDEAGRPYERHSVRLFSESEVAHPAATLASGVLTLLALLSLFVGLAASRWKDEPRKWRAHLAVASAAVLAALVACLAWPSGVPWFWGGRTYGLVNATGSATLTATPGLGWWLAVVSLVLLAAALPLSRRGMDQSATPGTSDK